MLYGSADIDELVKQVKAVGQTAVALTDYSNLFNAVNFIKAAQSEGIKPIIGVDLYFCEDAKQSKIHKSRQVYHMVLLAETEKGLANIARLASIANSEDYYYYNPRIDFNLLEKHKEGVICLTGSSLDGVISYNLYDKTSQDGEVSEPAALFKAEGIVRRLIKIFGNDNLFLEVQNNFVNEQATINIRLRQIAKKYNLRTVATNNVHYVRQHDAEAHKTLLEMNTNKYQRSTYTNFSHEEYYIKTREEMEACDFTKEELDLTNEIANRCHVVLDLKKRRLPKYQFVPEGKTGSQYLHELANDGLKRLVSDINAGDAYETYQHRLDRELKDIEEMGFVDYFLIVYDVVNWIRHKNVLLGHGRGSAGGSLVSYTLGITEIDPLKYGLIWERFLNKGRGGLPDIDTDVPRSFRQDALEYIKDRFGARNVAQLVTLSGLQAKAVLKEVFRVYDMPFDEANKITALVPAKNDEHVPISLQEAIDTVPELKAYYDKYTPWFKIALALEGCYKSTGIHAAAVVISDIPFDESPYPLTRSKDGDLIFGWDMNTVDSLSLLKLDILGLTTLDDIQVTMDLVKKRRKIDLSRKLIPLDDPKTWAMLCQGFTMGIFQIEKQLGKTWSKNLEPQNIDQLSDLVSIIRPGPMESQMHTAYRNVKIKGEAAEYIHPSLEPIMGRTYSALLYQEQVIEICKQLASMSLADADSVRKAMGKKKPEEMKKWKEKFIAGCVANGISDQISSDIWDYVDKFSGYGFNKSHGIGYALLAYETAYLKANYTIEFFCAKLRHTESHPEKFEQLSALVYDAKLFDLEVVPPRIKHANKDFDIISDKQIAFGMTALKGVGNVAINDLIKISKECTTLDDMIWQVLSTKNKISSAAMLALIRGGAFDDMQEHRVESQRRFRLLENLTAKDRELIDTLLPFQEGLKDRIKIVRAISDEQKATIIKEKYSLKLPNISRRKTIRELLAEYDNGDLFDSKAQRIAWEQHYLGISLSGSEADIYRAKDKCIDLIKHGEPETRFEIAVCVDSIREIITKKGDPMAFVTARDNTYMMDNIVVFPQTFSRAKYLLEAGSIIKIRGKMDERGSLIADIIERVA